MTRQTVRGGHPREPVNLNAEKTVLLHVLLDGSIEGGQDLRVLKIVINMHIQGVFAQLVIQHGPYRRVH